VVPPVPGGGAKIGAAAIGCGAAFVAALASLFGLAFLAGRVTGLLMLVIEFAIGVLCFFGFRALMHRNPSARVALYAFAIVFLVLFGGFAACVGLISNFNFR